MLDEIDEEYYRKRALYARQRAEEAVNPSIATVHRNFAEEYERRAAAVRTSRKSKAHIMGLNFSTR
ncbi:hypothetical protein [Sphingobium sp.]|uniref:hypothetical protein n=1 Tax=Sphingobium sp. TaxID=1912891 RepID=UPI002B783809|nr:hypothetical protein [Sphingobium sp.]HUD95320.1 hypothetical protein [Sphingobium sp.]